jgi:Uncharacterized conserved protein
MQEVYDFLKKSGTYYLATVDGDQPRVRPFGTIDMYDGKLFIQTGKKKDVAKQIEKNPKIEISACFENGWIRIEAIAVEGDLAAQEHMLEEYPNLKGMYTIGDGNTVVYWLKDATATINSFADAPKVIKF